MRDVSIDILEWSKDRPTWQRDALRRIFSYTHLSPQDFKELAEQCKSEHGLVESQSSVPFTNNHISISGGLGAAVSLVSITHHSGVNALAPEQTIAFGPRLVVVYGANTAGKSGYTRILKRACRSRGRNFNRLSIVRWTPPSLPISKHFSILRSRNTTSRILSKTILFPYRTCSPKSRTSRSWVFGRQL